MTAENIIDGTISFGCGGGLALVIKWSEVMDNAIAAGIVGLVGGFCGLAGKVLFTWIRKKINAWIEKSNT